MQQISYCLNMKINTSYYITITNMIIYMEQTNLVLVIYSPTFYLATEQIQTLFLTHLLLIKNILYFYTYAMSDFLEEEKIL